MARPTTRRSPRAAERATALVMVPATLLVLVVLGAVAVDLSAVHAAQRSLYRETSAAADDAAGVIDGHEYQRSGRVSVDADGARRLVEARLRSADLPGRLVSLEVRTTPETVVVAAEVAVPHVFLSAVPGHPDDRRVSMTARARLLP